MWMASILQVLALGAVDPAAPLAASAAPAPIYWRQTLFSIPFHVEHPNQAAQEPSEVQLHVSPDRGLHWDNWRQAPPQKGYFLFKAGTDGEYWFDVRTVDRSGQIRPQGPHTPKLIVIVDTVPPKVQLAAVRGEAGQITAAFRIEELYPKLDSLAIEYRLAPTAPWQAVSVGPRDVHSNNAEHTGEVTWYPQNAPGTMEVRLRVNDMAGNPAESHTLVHAAAGNRGNGESHASSGGGRRGNSGRNEPPGPQTPIPPAAASSPSFTAAAATTLPAAAKPDGSVATAWTSDGQNALAGGERQSGLHRPGKSGRFRRMIPATARLRSASIRRSRSDLSPINSRHRPRQPQHRRSRRTRSMGSPPAARAGLWRPRQPPATSGRRRACSFAGSTRGFSSSPTTPAPSAARPMCPSNCGERATAASHGRASARIPKGQSPMLVTVPDDGIYGFRMAIQNGPGMAGRPPLPGDVPGIWIGIDLTRPVGRITLAQQGIGRDGDKLFIAWEASDNHQLAAKPISLSYSERLGGPWTSMAAGLENTRAVCLAAHRQPAAADVFAAGGPRRRRQHGRLRNAGAGDARSFQSRRAASRSASPRAGSTSAG